MSDVEAAWVGAALDGEGCVRLVSPGYHYGFDLANTDMEFISAMLRATGVGAIYTRAKAKAHHKFILIWRVHRKEDALTIARRCSAYSVKCQRLLQLS